MSLHRTNIALTHEQWRFIEKNHMSLTKVVKPYLDKLILKEKEKNSLSFAAETILTQTTEKGDLVIIE